MEAFASIYEKLDKQCSYYSRHLGHIKGLIENEDWTRVVDRSMSGRVLLLGNSEITNALILFNTRMFDAGSDAITLHRLGSQIPTEKEVKQHHIDRMASIGVDYDLEEFFTARSELIDSNRKLKRNRTILKLQELRNYTLAHNIDPETEPDKATLNDLLELTEAVNEVVDLAGFIVTSSRGVYRGFADQAENETRMLYAALPVLADAEVR